MTLTIGFTAAKARRGRKPAHDSVLRSLRFFAAHPIPLQNTKDIVTQGDASRTNPSILPKPPHHPQPPLTSSLSCLPACGLHSSALASNPTQGLSFFTAFLGQKHRKIKACRLCCCELILLKFSPHFRVIHSILFPPTAIEVRRNFNSNRFQIRTPPFNHTHRFVSG